MATATAVRDARAGQRVLIVSTDQAHSTGDVLGADVPPTGLRTPTQVPVDDGAGVVLDALALDTLALLEARWREVAAVLVARFPDSDVGDVAPEELSALPGIQEVLGLHEVAELAASGNWDHVIVDCASTADAMRMLTLPAAFALYLEKAWPRHRRLSVGLADAKTVAMVTLVERLAAATEALGELLDQPDVTAHLVLTPERVVVAEAVRTLASLTLMGVHVSELVVNQVLIQDDSYEYVNLPAHPAFDWYAERIAEQWNAVRSLSCRGEVAGQAFRTALHLPPGLGDRRDRVVHRDADEHPDHRPQRNGDVADQLSEQAEGPGGIRQVPRHASDTSTARPRRVRARPIG